VSRCNLCGGSRFTVVAHHDRYGFAAQSLGCRDCGLVFLSPRLEPDAYARFYNGVYRLLVSAFHGRRIDAETVETDQIPYAERLAELLGPFFAPRPAGVILDVGGSTGVVSALLAEALSMRALVLDPAPDEVERARARGLEGVVGTIEEWERPDERFGLVLLCQTIDHLLDVAGALAAIRDVIAEDGYFFVDIVDFRAAYLRNDSVEAATKIDHPYSLTEATAEAYLERAGFAVELKDYAPDHLHIGYLCRPATPSPDTRPSAASVARLFAELRAVQNRPR
jgi:SAM-dependent methyltransferase